jgi:hypothetical protein
MKYPSRAGNGKSIIYFVREKRGAIKIGRSQSLNVRLVCLQSGNPRPLKVMGTMEVAEEKERELHKKFSRHQIQGEWFRPHKNLLSFIRKNTV